MPFVLLAIIAIIIGIATIVENNMGTPFVLDNIYGTWWIKLLWGIMAVFSVWQIYKRKLWKQTCVFLLHCSFLTILIGAMLTSIYAQKGVMHVRTNTPVAAFMTNDKHIIDMPFLVRLDSFAIEYYPGTDAPSDYISSITCLTNQGKEIVSGRISMNNIFKHGGYRLYQTSFDNDRKGTWLTVNHDPWGIRVTYLGYALLACSALLILFMRKGKLRTLLRHPALRKYTLCFMLLCIPSTSFAQVHKPTPVIRLEDADRYRNKQVIYNNRVVPLNTLAIDFVSKLYGKKTFKGLTPEQVIISWMLHPDQWQYVNIIKIKDRELRTALGITSEYASVSDLFDNKGNYRLNSIYKNKAGKHSKLEKATRETDEKVAIILMLTNGTLAQPITNDSDVELLSTTRINAELLYNSIPFSKILFMFNLTVGFLLIIIYLFKPTDKRGITIVTNILLYFSTIFLLIAFLLRWYIGGRIPLSNGYETMVFVALSTLIISCLLSQRTAIIAPFGLIISGFTLLVSHLAQMNPQITPLMPVLQSPLLSSHVSLIMVSYAFFAFMALNAITSLIMMHKSTGMELAERLTVISRIMLYPATFFLAIGIFIGAVWANVSWGSYWSWDPKETWALITMIVYGIAFHDTSLPWLRDMRKFNIYIALAFLTVIMTYFGVNHLLGGMHSYANG